MTVLTGIFWPSTSRPIYTVDPVAFSLALVVGPLLITACLCFLLIPVVALVLGWPVFLLLGVPTLLWWMRRYEPTPRAVAKLAFKMDVLLIIVGGVSTYMTSNDFLLSFAILGLFFAPAWGAAFAKCYLRFRRSLYAPRNGEIAPLDLKEGDI